MKHLRFVDQNTNTLQLLKDDLWPNPLQYYLVPDIEFECDNAENSDEGEEEEEQFDDDDGKNKLISFFLFHLLNTRFLRLNQLQTMPRMSSNRFTPIGFTKNSYICRIVEFVQKHKIQLIHKKYPFSQSIFC